MAYPDTVAVTPGAGAGIAVDTAAGAKFQVVKLDIGATGATGLLGTGNPLPAQLWQQLSASQGYSWAKLDSAAGGNIDLIAGVGGQTVRVYGGYFTVASPVTVQFADSTPTTVTGAMTFGLGGGMVLPIILGPNGIEPHIVTAVGKGFRIVMGSAVQISGQFAYKQS